MSNNRKIATLRHLARTDLYFLLRYLLGREDVEHPWIFDRCREVQENPDGFLDLWAREHYKSTIITFAKTIQDILASHGEGSTGTEITVGIFSCTRPIAKGFLRQIKRELEGNQELKNLFPDVLWENPSKDAPKWSEDDGLILRRKSNPKESTLEAWGLVDAQPTSKHFPLMVYDDVVTVDYVRSTDMIRKTTESLELSYNLGARGGKRRFVGTRYHFNDSYRTLIKRGTAKPRIYEATEDGETIGEPVLLTKEELAEKRRDMGPYTYACQMLLNPKADEKQGFKEEWIKYYKDHQSGEGMNIYILVDPASEKKKSNDYTSLFVMGLGADENYYVLEFYRDRLNLKERADLLFKMHKKWRPLNVGYEKYGMMADVEHIQDRMERENYRFEIKEVGGQLAKNDRIKRLIPLYEQGRVYFPHTQSKTNYQNMTEDLVEVFIQEEYKAFPVPVHDDMMDCQSRICDLTLEWPKEEEVYPDDNYEQPVSWMA